eukprot:TRINITY_DN42227_c0_g1_i1.p1 TRINITY_DN42227_c0_g1~~TRINITY_DN42227_c0_g1_i1.p1  ORF type:complete len:614 (+),score=100.47 TRINITY_DN42227_c0_g1_i1:139-1842(+)
MPSEVISFNMPALNEIIQNMIVQVAVPLIDAALPRLLHGAVKVQQCSLGGEPPHIGPVSLRKRDELTSVLDIGVKANFAMEFFVSALGIGVGLDRLAARGILSIAFQRKTTPPYFSGVEFYFVNPPEIEYHFTGLGRCTAIPGIRGIIQTALMGVLCRQMVLPSRLVIDCGGDDDAELVDLASPDPLGVLRLTFVSGTDLVAADLTLGGWTHSDPYVTVQVAQEIWKSSTVRKSLNPEWSTGNIATFLIFELSQQVRITVYDEDTVGSDDLIGEAGQISAVDLIGQSKCAKKTVLPLTYRGRPGGSLLVVGEWLDSSGASSASPLKSYGNSGARKKQLGSQILVKAQLYEACGMSNSGGPFVVRLTVGDRTVKSLPGKPRLRRKAAVEDLMRVCRQLARRQMDEDAIAEIVGLTSAAVRAVIDAGEATQGALVAAARRAARVVPNTLVFNQALRLLLPADEGLKSGATARLEALDGSGQRVGAVIELPLVDLLHHAIRCPLDSSETVSFGGCLRACTMQVVSPSGAMVTAVDSSCVPAQGALDLSKAVSVVLGTFQQHLLQKAAKCA